MDFITEPKYPPAGPMQAFRTNMRDTWYADNRDLVKWGTLAHIARREELDLIIQVPYLRCGDHPSLHTDNGQVAIEPAVWNFFRNISAVEALGRRLGRRIIVITDIFDPHKREAYRQRVASKLDDLHQSKVVLLDPDTGISAANPSAKHVDADDIKAAWRPLRRGDWLVIYQHASRRKNWRDEALQRFAGACGPGNVEAFSAPKIAWDVAFLAGRKGGE